MPHGHKWLIIIAHESTKINHNLKISIAHFYDLYLSVIGCDVVLFVTNSDKPLPLKNQYYNPNGKSTPKVDC